MTFIPDQQYTFGNNSYTQNQTRGTMSGAVQKDSKGSLVENNDIAPVQVNYDGSVKTTNNILLTESSTDKILSSGFLTVDISSESTGTFDVTGVTGSAPSSGYISIDDEIIEYTGFNGSQVTLVNRGDFGTIPSPHLSTTRIFEVFSGTFSDLSAYSSITFGCFTDQDGTIYLDFKSDLNSDIIESILSWPVTANVNEVHRITITRRYGRIRFVNNSGNIQSFFTIQTLVGEQGPLTIKAIDNTIPSDWDTNVVRSITAGITPDTSISTAKLDGTAFQTVSVLAGTLLDRPLLKLTDEINVESVTYISGGSGYVNDTNVFTSAGSGALLDITVDDSGTITSVEISNNNAGTLYTPGNTLSILAGITGVGASVQVDTVGASGEISGLTGLTGGLGYAPGTFTEIATNAGSAATVDISVVSGGVTGTINNRGYDYIVGNKARILASGGNSDSYLEVVSIFDGYVNGVFLTNGGAGYTDGTYYDIGTTTVEGGTGASVDIYVINGSIVDVINNRGGFGYEIGDILTVSGGAATVTVTSIQNGVINEFSIIPGSEYTNTDHTDVPTLSGSGATVNIITAAGEIVAAEIDEPGQNYNVGNTCTIDGGTTNASFKISSVNDEGGIVTISDLTLGAGYSNGTKNIISGSGLTVDIRVKDHSVIDAVISATGSNYYPGDIVVINEVLGNNGAGANNAVIKVDEVDIKGSVVSLLKFENSGVLALKNNGSDEEVTYTGITGTTFIGCKRSTSGTVGSYYQKYDPIGQVYDSGILNGIGYTQVNTTISCNVSGRMIFNFHQAANGSNIERSLAIPYGSTDGFRLLAAPLFTDYVQYKFRNTSGTGELSLYYNTDFLTKGLTGQLLTLNQFIADGMVAPLTRSVFVGKDPQNVYKNVRNDGYSFQTKTNLEPGQSYDSGLIDMGEYSQIQTELVSNRIGRLLGTWYSDSTGTQIVRTFTRPYLEEDVGNYVYFASPTFAPYLRYVFTNDSTQTQTNFFLGLRLLTKSVSGQILGLRDFIPSNVVANLGRNVLVGEDSNNNFRNVPVDNEGFLGVSIQNPTTAFGDLRNTELNPVIQVTFPYNINTDIVTPDIPTGSTGYSDQSMLVLETGTGVTGYAEIRTIQTLKYRAGLGALARFTALFESGATGSTQIIGIGDSEDGFFVGYTGDAFGFLKRRDGQDEWTLQTNWNIDVLDGSNVFATNPSGLNLIKTNINVFQISFQWLGAGEINLSVEDPKTGGFIRVHRVRYANNNTIPSIFNPTLPMLARVENDGNTTNLVLKSASMAAFIEGKNVITGPSNSAVTIDDNTSLAIRSDAIFQNKTNKVNTLVRYLSASNTQNNSTTRISIILGGTFSGTLGSFSDPTNNSVIRTAIGNVGGNVSDGKLLAAFVVGGNGALNVDLSPLNIIIKPGDTLYVTCSPSGQTTLTVNWIEDF